METRQQRDKVNIYRFSSLNFSFQLMQKLMSFYNKYNPEKMSSVAETVAKYENNEFALWTQLYTKYNVKVFFLFLTILIIVILLLIFLCYYCYF